MKIKISNDVFIDLDKLIESRMVVQANSGGGKSWTIRRLIEQAFGHVQIIVIDPEGEFGNMRGHFDFVYAGKDGDAPVESRSAALLAQRLLELKASAIVDLYELPPQERKRFVRLFLDSMVNSPKELWHDCIVILDEADLFAPEKRESEALSAVIDMAGRGRKRGYCIIPATRRPAQLNKDVAAECNNKIIGRASLDIDRKRSAEELGFTTKDQIISLRNLDPGEFYCFGPAISRDIIKTTVGDIIVPMAKRGQNARGTPPPTEKVRKILGQLADLPHEAEAEAKTSAELKMKNADLQRRLTIAERKATEAKPTAVKVERIEVPTIGKRSLEKIFSFEKVMRKMIATGKEQHLGGMSTLQQFEKDLDKLMQEVQKVTRPIEISGRPITLSTENFGEVMQRAVDMGKANLNQGLIEFTPTGSQQKILNALKWLDGIGVQHANRVQLAFLADQTSTSSGYINNLGGLRTAGLVLYPAPGMVMLTPHGHGLAEASEVPRSTEELHRQIQSKITKSQWSILATLIKAYPQPIHRMELAEGAGQSVNSSGFVNNLGALRSLGLVDYPAPGQVVALEILFIK